MPLRTLDMSWTTRGNDSVDLAPRAVSRKHGEILCAVKRGDTGYIKGVGKIHWRFEVNSPIDQADIVPSSHEPKSSVTQGVPPPGVSLHIRSKG